MATFPQFSLLNHLEKHAPVICDGAKPLLLREWGFPETNACFLANLTHPALVSQMHQAYLNAGASILRINTEGAHQFVLETLEIENRGENINNNGMALLRKGVGMRGIPAASVTSIKKDISGDIPKPWMERAYGTQLIYQADTGARFVMFSEFADWEDLKTAVRVAKRSVQKQIVAHLKFTLHDDPSTLTRQLEEVQKNADFIGIQASWQHPKLVGLTASIIHHFGIVSILLDETLPQPFGQVATGFPQVVENLLSHEPAIIGGGANTTPAHIRTIASLVGNSFEKPELSNS